MSKLYEVAITDEDKEAIVTRGEIDALRFIEFIPAQADSDIYDLVDIYDHTTWGIFLRIFRGKPPTLAWAYIFLDREYAIADIVRDTIPADSGIALAHYSSLYNPSYPNDQHSVGCITIDHKAGLERIASTLPLWCAVRRVMADADITKHWIAILDPLPKDWSDGAEDHRVFNVLHEYEKRTALSQERNATNENHPAKADHGKKHGDGR